MDQRSPPTLKCMVTVFHYSGPRPAAAASWDVPAAARPNIPPEVVPTAEFGISGVFGPNGE